jgi:hypothetical protein
VGRLDVPFEMTAGEVVIAAHYSANDSASVMDGLGHFWSSLPKEDVDTCAIQMELRFYWTVAASSGLTTISSQGVTPQERGMFIVSYRGTATMPVDVAAGNYTLSPVGSFDAGELMTSDDDHLVAVIAARGGSRLEPGPGARVLAQDNVFAAVMLDKPGPMGTHSLSAMADQAPTCWIGSTVALSPSR